MTPEERTLDTGGTIQIEHVDGKVVLRCDNGLASLRAGRADDDAPPCGTLAMLLSPTDAVWLIGALAIVVQAVWLIGALAIVVQDLQREEEGP